LSNEKDTCRSKLLLKSNTLPSDTGDVPIGAFGAVDTHSEIVLAEIAASAVYRSVPALSI
jgi:hypothetical protein